MVIFLFCSQLNNLLSQQQGAKRRINKLDILPRPSVVEKPSVYRASVFDPPYMAPYTEVKYGAIYGVANSVYGAMHHIRRRVKYGGSVYGGLFEDRWV